MPGSADYLYHTAAALLTGTAPPWSGPVLYAALATASDQVPTRSGVSLDDVELAFEDLLTLPGASVQAFVDQDPPPPDPSPTTPEVLPYAIWDTSGVIGWTNAGDAPIEVKTIAAVVLHEGTHRLLFWGPYSHTVNPAATWGPPAIALRIVSGTAPEPWGSIDAVVCDVRYETVNHRGAAKHVDAGDSPSVLTWGDLGGDLAAEFKRALADLEGLLYVIAGSPPASYGPLTSWRHRAHPRCLWHPEQWYKVWCSNAEDPPACNRYHYEIAEMAATGDSHLGAMPKPTVPIRSRSGDWKLQQLDGSRVRDSKYFPRLSVTRTDGAEAFDPQGSGDFGGDPDAIGSDGPIHYGGEDVTISYPPPDDVTCTAATLHWNGNTTSMTFSAGVWTATIPAQPHNTPVEFYVEGAFTAPEAVTRYEPGGESPPGEGEGYTFVFFTHHNPYKHGLPELWDACRKGTDAYEFSAEETVQHALINLVRMACDWIGREFNHSPKLRSSLPLCCIEIPIVWRWAGAAKWPLHKTGGFDGIHPLHNMDFAGEGVDSLPRRSWRGHPFQFSGNIWYPGADFQASWLAPPARVEALVYDEEAGTCAIRYDGNRQGLRPGDIIEPIHIRQLIAAIDYMCDENLWRKHRIKRSPATPVGTFLGGLHCGEGHHTDTGSPDVDDYNEGGGCFAECHDDGHGGLDCTTWAAPDNWRDCFTSETASGICSIHQWFVKVCDHSTGSWVTSADTNIGCYGGWGPDGYSGPGECGPQPFQIGGYAAWKCSSGAESGSGDVRHECEYQACGWSAYVCSPQRAPYGPDAMHGNGTFKARDNHGCPFSVTLFYPYSMGNRLGEVVTCGKNMLTGLDDIGFESIHHVQFEGWTGSFQCMEGVCSDTGDCGHFDAESDIAMPGYASRWSWEDPPAFMCSEEYDEDVLGIVAGLGCALNLSTCSSDQVWCSLTLNRDESGRPVLYEYEAFDPDDIHFNPEEVDPPDACMCETLYEGSC